MGSNVRIAEVTSGWGKNTVLGTVNDNSTSDYFRIISTGRIKGSPTNHTVNTVVQKIYGKDGPKLLTHYWNDNSFEDIFRPELETS